MFTRIIRLTSILAMMVIITLATACTVLKQNNGKSEAPGQQKKVTGEPAKTYAPGQQKKKN